MLRRLLSFGLSGLLVLSAVPPVSARAITAGEITGIAMTQGGQYLSNHTARVRSLDAGDVRSSATTNSAGSFSFTGLAAGIYVVELVSGTGAVIGTSTPVTLSEKAPHVGGVIATAAAANQAQTGALSGSFWTSTLGIVVASAVVAGVVTAVVIAQKDDASPSN